MKITIAGPKLDRLIYLLENESNAKVLGDKLIAQTVTGATATNVREVGGTHLEYRFKLPTDTTTGWLKKRAMRITKKFIDDFNEAAQAAYDAAVAADQNPDELDPDSDETRIAQAIAWIRFNVRGGSKDIDVDNDLVEIIALSGVITAANFLIQVKEAGQIVENPKTFQQRLKATRLDIKTVFPEDPIVITSLNHTEIREQLINSLMLPVPDAGGPGSVKALFPEDIMIQMVHYKVGSRYLAIIANAALDYYGEIPFSIGVAEDPDPVTTSATYNPVTGDLVYSGTGVYYTYSHIFDPELNEVQVKTPDFGLVEDFHLGFKLKINGANGTDYVEVSDNLQGTPARSLKRLTGAGPVVTDSTLTAFGHSEITVNVIGNTVNVSIKDLSGTPAPDEIRQYTMAGFGPAPGEKLYISLQVDVNPANVPGTPSTVATNVKLVAKGESP